MDRWRRNPTLFQINAITWTGRLARALGRPVTLYDIPDEELDRFASRGFDLVWAMGVWQRGPRAVEIALANPKVPPELSHALPDWRPEDVIGSPFAIQAYTVDPDLGGDDALASLRRRLAERGIGLIVDFVPNHVACDHPWVHDRPELLVSREPEWAEREPDRYFAADTVRGPRAIAYGKDPHFVGWVDTAQLNYRHPALRAEMCRVVADIAARADGVRCDMAMLVFDDVFANTWPEAAIEHPEPPNEPFWPQAIAAGRAAHPRFLFIAEVYWAMEGRMLENGFDFAYDKAFYDLVRSGNVGAIQQSARAPESHLDRCVHFIENHDEEPAIDAFGPRTTWAAAITATLPGLRLFHEGQFDGRDVRLPVQLGRPNGKDPDPALLSFYERLLHVLTLPALREGRFHVVDVEPFRDDGEPGGDGEDDSFWNVLVYRWDHVETKSVILVVSNLAGTAARAVLPLSTGLGREVEIIDLLSDAREIAAKGSTRLRVSLSPYEVRILAFEAG